jgi:hybrid cluster-associated redox disulfide protein
MKMITKETVIGEIVQKGDKYIEILINAGMHCLGCPASAGETLEEACAVHGIDVDSVLEELNKIA